MLNDSNYIAALDQVASIAYQAVTSNNTNYVQISRDINECFVPPAEQAEILESPFGWYLQFIKAVKIEFARLEEGYHKGKDTVDQRYSLLEVLIRNVRDEIEQRRSFLHDEGSYDAKVLIYPSTDPRLEFQGNVVVHCISLDMVTSAENEESAIEQCLENIQLNLERGYLANCAVAPAGYFKLYEDSIESRRPIQYKGFPRMTFHMRSSSIEER